MQQLAVAGCRALLGNRDLLLAAKDTCPVTLRWFLATSPSVPCGDDFAAADAGAGAEVDDVVGGPHRVFVVLDDDDRVAQVAQPAERVEQPVVVARVQADRRLVENVEHADQAAADLAGQANALRLAAGKRRGGAVERQVVEADVRQEAEPAADFLEHFGGDQLSALPSSSSSLKNSAASETGSAQTSGSVRVRLRRRTRGAAW